MIVQMNEELLSQIEDLGLSEKEARVYLANLMIGPATVQKIADQADIKRVTTYVILESLSSLGLVSKSNQGKKTFFTAEDPISLRRLLDKKEQQVAEQKTAFEGLLPDLESLRNIPTDTPGVKFYDTEEGLRSVMKTFLSEDPGADRVVYTMHNVEQLYDFFPDTKENKGNPDRIKSGVKSMTIYTHPDGPILHSTDKEKNRESRWVPQDKFPLVGEIAIFGSHIMILSYSGTKPIGIRIDSVALADGLRAIFSLAWAGAETYNK
jgi:sugar-specific transcriptional regulator TrmB